MKITNRSSGILLHISSLPSDNGIGDFGVGARKWIDFLSDSGITYWQILPINPTGFGNSPYQGLSAFAGNALFIDLQELLDLGLLQKEDFKHKPSFSKKRINYTKVSRWKFNLLKKAFLKFIIDHPAYIDAEYKSFVEENSYWLDAFSLFMAIREHFANSSWQEWPSPFRKRDPKTLEVFIKENSIDIQFQSFLQFFFNHQFTLIKNYAKGNNLQLIGDIPIFMGYDSADVWAYPDLFELDDNFIPTSIAGVPPDYFSEDGQLWGNPLYKWGLHQSDHFSWWSKRISHLLHFVDLIRLDHFRGFAAYYKIPAEEKTAKGGEWVTGPGSAFFEALLENIGKLPFIAEDLGVITPDVIALREKYDFPGMKLLQFGFSKNAENEYLPHNFPSNCIAYTGTHDNNTSYGWYQNLKEAEKLFFSAYSGIDDKNIPHEMIRLIWRSNASLAIAPMQDFLQLRSDARMNRPSSIEGNWEWRLNIDQLSKNLLTWIKNQNIVFDRVNLEKNWNLKDLS